jgi:hypothetical protein
MSGHQVKYDNLGKLFSFVVFSLLLITNFTLKRDLCGDNLGRILVKRFMSHPVFHKSLKRDVSIKITNDSHN